MIRMLALSGIAASLAWTPADAQQVPELEGAPGSHAIEQAAAPTPVQKPAPKKTSPTTASVKATQIKLAQQAEQQKAEQMRLAKQADELKARQAALDARAASLAAEEKRLAQVHADQQAQLVAKQAELTKQAQANRATSVAAEEKRLAQLPAEQQAQLATKQAERTKQQTEADAMSADRRRPEEPRVDAAPRREPAELYRTASPRVIFAAARRACTTAAEDEALSRNFDDASYDGEPRLYQRGGWEMRGRMRLGDGRGYLLVDTVCEVDDAGAVQHFAMLR